MKGSINLDGRSLLLNHESAVVFYDAHDIDWLARDVAEGLVLTLAFQL